MRHTITQFMWGFQRHFRMSIEGLAETALADIGIAVAPRAYLVGFAETKDAPFVVCIEPEDGPFLQQQLAGVVAVAEQEYLASPERGFVNTDPGVDAQYHARLRDRSRRDALSTALAATPGGADRRFFAGPGVVIDQYRVHPVVAVLTSRWDELPQLKPWRDHSLFAYASLQHAVIDGLLFVAARALAQREPPSTVLTDSDADSAGVLRAAADHFVTGTALRTRELLGSGFRAALDAVAAQPYEGRTGIGALLLAHPDHPHIRVDIAFDRAVQIRETRAFRKVLEMSGPDLPLLCDGRQVYGMGQLADSYDRGAEDCFAVTIVGRGSWELAHTGLPLLRVDNGHPRLPRERLSRRKFADTVLRLFPSSTPAAADGLWGMAEACSLQAHGTMLVVHPHAADEGQRLVPQALTISPTELHGDTLTAMTSIDGAVLVSPDGLCHAVGVILDGTATGTGDPARGARYNSAVRYLAGQGHGSLVIIVSEDGMIDLLPDLPRRVRRDEVQAAVDKLVAAAAGEIDFEEFFRLDRHVEALEFYLDQVQCDAVNSAKQAVEDHRWQHNQMRVVFAHRVPHPNMNDSYFLD